MIKSADAAGLKADSSADVEAIRDICNHLQALASGNAKGTVYAQSAPADPVAASGTWTLDTVVATDTVTVGPITFTGTDTPTTNLHFDTSLATDALIAADIARAVNEHPVASTIVTASAASAVVTVTAKVRGVVGNWIAFTDGDSTITSSGSGYLAGGTGGVTDAEATYNFGE
jgi:phage tail sheath gpL-like